MAESPPSSPTSQKPQIEKLGLELLIPQSDPISTDHVVQIHNSKSPPLNAPTEVMAEENVQEVEFRNAIEREISQLTIEQAEIETAARGRSGVTDDDEGEGSSNMVIVRKNDLGEGKIEKDSGSVEDGNGNEGNVEQAEIVITREEESMDVVKVRKDDLCEVKVEKDAEYVEDGNEIEGNLEQAEMEIAHERLGDVYDDGWGIDVETVRTYDLDVGTGEKDAEESVEYEYKNVWEDEENLEGKSGEDATIVGGHNQNNNRRKINYPMRPDAEDCGFYVKFGSCKFGPSCKFNHPFRRKNQGVVKERVNHREENLIRPGQTECKYYRTSAGCKYGNDCKYSHGSEKSSTSHTPDMNFLGLPIRPGEKECTYYMRTGSCKYGSSCRFNHPDPTTVVGGDSPSGYGNGGGGSLPSQLVSSSPVSSWSSPRAFNESSPFAPMFPPNQSAPTSNPEWNGYQAPAYPTSERSLPTPPAFAINNVPPAEVNFPNIRHHQQRDMLVIEEYPERPGEPECSYFLKTGDCKYKSNCKFHHPKARANNTYALSDKGLPLRPDQPICTHYHRYGICKYGPACKYDHPSQFAILPPAFDHRPSYGNSGAENFRRRNES